MWYNCIYRVEAAKKAKRCIIKAPMGVYLVNGVALPHFHHQVSDRRRFSLRRCVVAKGDKKMLLGLDEYKEQTGFDWEDGPWFKNYMKRQKRKCAYCGERGPEQIDHVIPKKRGGSNDPSNLVYACGACNFKKGNRTPEQAGMVIRFPNESKVGA